MKMVSPCALLLLLFISSSFHCCCCFPQRDRQTTDRQLTAQREKLLLHKQDVSRSLADLLLSDLLTMENQVLQEENFPLSDDPDDLHAELQRSAGNEPLLAPRERKAGCKNFFWKTFTSC
ncbi:somatostatin 1, tandem duplicate 1 [Gouania willdenowi]|uniref:Somatostatin-1-like n=1 Tax=Gouania willdenowi TaxID=441366 RepID=A0A8C5E496_GOUWI|nr:somatostatin-1-like [Gouania willdenowi]